MNRHVKCQIANLFGRTTRVVLILLAIVLAVVGFLLIFYQISIGWLVISISIYPLMLMEWYNGELKIVTVDSNDKTYVGLTDYKILGLLPKDPSPLDFANALLKSKQDGFFRYRFGIASEALTGIASSDKKDIDSFWQSVIEIIGHTASTSATPEVIATAIIKTSEHSDLLLSPNLLDLESLYDGIRWRNHYDALTQKAGQFRKTGGLARDWSFGWTPLLNKYGQNLSLDGSFALPTVGLPSREDTADHMFKLLSGTSKRNVALIGTTGSGKTSILRYFGDKLMDGSGNTPDNMLYNQLILLDASRLLSDVKAKNEIESALSQIFTEAYAAKNIVLGFDNAHLFFEEGNGSTDVSNVLKPILEYGTLPIIMVFNDQKYSTLVSRDPEIANLINRLTIQPASEDETMTIMQDAIVDIEYSKHVTFMYQSLKEAYSAGMRYVSESSMPAQAVILLQDAANYSTDGLVTAQAVRKAVEAKYGIKMGVAQEQDEKQKLLNLETLIHERMVNQNDAVAAVSSALRRARAGVRNEDKPIGTFLFIGPTGVGKTELAKSLADVYFGGEDRLVRIDLNEYVTSKDVIRLIEDAGSSSMSLTAQVIRQPFSVVLLDEIEKAHPKVLSTLLQMLDEGILVDEKNKKVSFRDSIIVATSNAGADRIREYVHRGLDVVKLKNQFVDELLEAGDFTPEFLNRFDEIIMFTPLSSTDLIKVLDIIIGSINKNLEKQKISVRLDDQAKNFLIDKGNDPVFGARPIKRIIQRVVENIVAKHVLENRAEPGTVIDITVDDMVSVVR